MSYFDQIMEKIFPDPAAVEKGKLPVVADVIKRNVKYLIAYQHWLNNDDKDLLINWLASEYTIASEDGSEWITQLNSKGIRGFFIHGGEESLKPQESRFLLDYWKEQIQKLNYQLYGWQSESFLRENKILVKERYYLKPYKNAFEFPINQEFGNILIEAEILEDMLLSIKCLVTHYTGFNYLAPKAYKELIKFMLN